MSIVDPNEFGSKYITKGFNTKDLAQNGLDLRISQLYMLDDISPARICDDKRMFPRRNLVEPIDGEYILYPGKFYEVVSNIEVTVPADAAGLIIARSSMLRCGVLVTSGVYDSGYSGKVTLFMYPTTCLTALAKDERIGQLLIFTAQAYQLYSGMFQGKGSTVDV